MSCKLPLVLGLAAAVSSSVWFWPERRPIDAAPITGEAAVFGTKINPDQVASLRVAAFDETNASAKILEVRRTNGLWTIPSHFDFPADGNTRVTKAAESFLGVAKGRPVADDAAKLSEFELLDPLDVANLAKKGHGKRVTMTDATGATVVDILVGKRVEGGSGIYYLREVASNQVFTAKVDPWELSTQFIDYVEPDPFKLKREEIRGLAISDYSVDEASGTVAQRSQTALVRAGSDAEWTCSTAPEGKRTSKTTIDALLTEATAVRLAGVRPYDKMWLQQRGFFITPQGLYGNEGSLSITTKDGLRHWLFFGEAALDDDTDKAAEKAKPAEPAAADKAKPAGTSRYLAVWVQYDEAADEDAKKPVEPPKEGAKPAKKVSGKERAEKAQKRFQQFFYVISDETFKKLRPAVDTLFEAKPAEPMAGNTGKTNVQWLDENGKRPGVTTTASGLQYEVISAGPADGAMPTDADTVEVRYKGTLVDGTEFDATKGDATASFGVTGVIKGWTEALKLMRPGDTWKLFIPPAIGYGEAGSQPKIGAHAILVFEVTLVKIAGK
jgi:FKBP-type peptidyl-prolyl cis-trans isomerase